MVVRLTDEDASSLNVEMTVDTGGLIEDSSVVVFTFSVTGSDVVATGVNITIQVGGTADTGDYSFANGSATTGIVTILSGTTGTTYTLTGTTDTLVETDESIIVDIIAVENAVESGTQQQTLTLYNDDVVYASIAVDTGSISESSGSAVVTATLSGTSIYDVYVNLGFAGAATQGTDYVVSSGQILISSGSTTGSMTITASPDTLGEVTEAIDVSIVSLSNALTGTTTTGTTDILDTTVLTVELSNSSGSISESGGVTTYTVTLCGGTSTQTVSVGLTYTGSATSGTDYSVATGTNATSNTVIDIPAGGTSGWVTITATDDFIVE